MPDTASGDVESEKVALHPDNIGFNWITENESALGITSREPIHHSLDVMLGHARNPFRFDSRGFKCTWSWQFL
jgi:hypothetical protein